MKKVLLLLLLLITMSCTKSEESFVPETTDFVSMLAGTRWEAYEIADKGGIFEPLSEIAPVPYIQFKDRKTVITGFVGKPSWDKEQPYKIDATSKWNCNIEIGNSTFNKREMSFEKDFSFFIITQIILDIPFLPLWFLH